MNKINNLSSQEQASAAAGSPKIPLILVPGDRITECSGLWVASERNSEELGKCHSCNQPTFRVVTIASAENLERRTALCGRHFIIAAKRLPELYQTQTSSVA